jgi:hypothetical protein
MKNEKAGIPDGTATASSESNQPPCQFKGPGQDFCEWRAGVDLRLDDGAVNMAGLHEKLAENTKVTLKVQEDTSELVSLINSFKGAFAVFDLVGRAAKPLGYVVMLATAIWGFVTAIKGGGSR